MVRFCVVSTLLILFTNVVYAQQVLSLAKLKNLPDQFIGEYILKEAYKQLDIELEFQELPASRALKNSNLGLVDGEIQRIGLDISKTPNLIQIPVVLNYVDSCFFYRKKMKYEGVEKLKDYSLVYARGIVGFEPWLAFFSRNRAVNTFSQAFKMIDMARADMTLSGCLMGAIHIKELGLANVFPLKPSYQRSDLFHYLHKKHKRIVPKITSVLEQMKKSGELGKLREQAIKILLTQS